MSPQAGELLVQEIAPRIRSSLSHCVSQVGPDDIDELVQDAIATAAKLLHSVETRAKKVTAGNISYYAVRLTREGRRSTGFKKTDPLHPAAQIAGRCRVVSLEEPLGGEIEDQETLCLHDVLAARDEDPSMAATRRLDWAGLVESLDPVSQAVLCCLIEAVNLGTLMPKLKRSYWTLRQDKQRLATLIRERLGEDILNQVQALPRWRNNLRAKQEKWVCRYERSLA
jgi:hypothetical protein